MADFFDQWEQWLQRLEEGPSDAPGERTQVLEEGAGGAERASVDPVLRRSPDEPSAA